MGNRKKSSKGNANAPKLSDLEFIAPGEGVEHMLNALMEAKHQFMTEEYGGRIGVSHALGIAIDFLEAFPPLRDQYVTQPLRVLWSALDALDLNNVQPLLTPRELTNRSPAGNVRLMTQAAAIFVADKLKEHGLKRAEADKRVAKILKDCGVGSAGSNMEISAATIRGWRERASRGKKSKRGAEISGRLAEMVHEFKKSPFDDIVKDKPKAGIILLLPIILEALLDHSRADTAS